MMRKLKSKKGETLIETLVAVLIVAAGSMVFLEMTSNANYMNKLAAETDTTYLTEISASETGEAIAGEVQSEPVTVTVGSDKVQAVAVGREAQIRSYRAEGVGG